MQLQLALQQRQVAPDIPQLLLCCISTCQLGLSLHITFHASLSQHNDKLPWLTLKYPRHQLGEV